MRLSSSARAKVTLLALCGLAGLGLCSSVKAASEPPHPKALDDAIIAAAKRHGVPERLVRRVIMRESKYDPRARNHRYWGLMQISYPTAKSMGFRGTPQELLNPVVNLRYAVPYLANAFVIAGKHEDGAVRLYAAGYYFSARARGLLKALRTADSTPLNGVPDDPQPVLVSASAPPAEGGLFGASPAPSPPPQAVAYAADASAVGQSPAAAAAQSAVAPAGTFKGPTADMVADKGGQLKPPKKWTRDGGTTLIARGEQSSVAHDEGAQDGRKSRRRSKKITVAAALDAQPGTAQAYAAPTAQDPRFAAAASQAAIAQATAQQAATGQPAVSPQAGSSEQPGLGQEGMVGQPGQQVASAQPAVAAAPEEVSKPSRHRRSRHAKRHKTSRGTQVAESKAQD